MTTKAIHAGTFDPITLGHVDIVARAAGLFDEVIVAVAESERKTPYYPIEKRLQFAKQALSHLKNVSVEALTGLTVDFVTQHKAHYLVRGVRSAIDFDYEAELAEMNRDMLDGNVDTIFLPTRPQFAYISSTMVRELILIKAFDQLKRFVPETILNLLQSD
ncbi:MAG: pantetheine-phosphate adenylyltransferase [Coxiella sp. (in: Bacteria)]|nr:MAG: pantetheine-phosphate adenylyltransferase [Coxiella sp. (in: g-proteobacteria)]